MRTCTLKGCRLASGTRHHCTRCHRDFVDLLSFDHHRVPDVNYIHYDEDMEEEWFGQSVCDISGLEFEGEMEVFGLPDSLEKKEQERNRMATARVARRVNEDE